MRIAGPDIVLFVIGLVLFGGASYAISQEEGGFTGASSALGLFSVTYAVELVEVGSEDVASLRSAEATFVVNESSILSVIADVACTGQTGDVGPVTFQLQVTLAGPNGQTGEGSGTCAAGATAEILIDTMPQATTVPGERESDAREALVPSANTTAATGEWTVTVSGARQGAPALPIPVGDPGGRITLSVDTARPTFTPIQR